MAVLKTLPCPFIQFKTKLFSHQSSFLHLKCFFFLVLCCRINTRWLDTTEQLTSSVQRSGEMQGLSSFLLKAGFEGEIVQRSVRFFVDFLDTKEGEEL